MKKPKPAKSRNFSQWVSLEDEVLINMRHVRSIELPADDNGVLVLRFANDGQDAMTLPDPGRLKAAALSRFLLQRGAAYITDVAEDESIIEDAEDIRRRIKALARQNRIVEQDYARRWEACCKQLGWSPDTGKPWPKQTHDSE